MITHNTGQYSFTKAKIKLSKNKLIIYKNVFQFASKKQINVKLQYTCNHSFIDNNCFCFVVICENKEYDI